jgi:hypothetical protein
MAAICVGVTAVVLAGDGFAGEDGTVKRFLYADMVAARRSGHILNYTPE